MQRAASALRSLGRRIPGNNFGAAVGENGAVAGRNQAGVHNSSLHRSNVVKSGESNVSTQRGYEYPRDPYTGAPMLPEAGEPWVKCSKTGKTICPVTQQPLGPLAASTRLSFKTALWFAGPCILYAWYQLSFGEYLYPDRYYVLASDNWRAKDSERLPAYNRDRGAHDHH
ncbi:unnamed protein product [Pedinophyceae sp. YPF-701]|nr:unnamed protein product [Pedinophyceae sp. YPF-701]